MKTLLGWIFDPYVDVFLIGLVLAQFGVGGGHEEATVSPASAAFYCERCQDLHEDWTDGRRVSCTLTKLLRRR